MINFGEEPTESLPKNSRKAKALRRKKWESPSIVKSYRRKPVKRFKHELIAPRVELEAPETRNTINEVMEQKAEVDGRSERRKNKKRKERKKKKIDRMVENEKKRNIGRRHHINHASQLFVSNALSNQRRMGHELKMPSSDEVRDHVYNMVQGELNAGGGPHRDVEDLPLTTIIGVHPEGYEPVGLNARGQLIGGNPRVGREWSRMVNAFTNL